MRPKRGESSLEIIISFVLFIFVLGFMLYYLIPLREQTVPDVLIDMVEEGLEEHATIKIQEITLAGDTEQATVKFLGNPVASWDESKNSWDLTFDNAFSASIEGIAITCPNGAIKTIGPIPSHPPEGYIEELLNAACPYKCTKFDKHKDLKNINPSKLHVKDEYDDRLDWQVSGPDFHIERKDENNEKDTLREYSIYYYLEDSVEGYESQGLNIGDCFILDSYNNSVSAFTKVYSKDKIKELQEMIDDPEIGPEKFKEEIFNFPVTSNFKVILNGLELKTAEVPEKTVVNAREILVETLKFEEENGREVLKKDLTKLSILVW